MHLGFQTSCMAAMYGDVAYKVYTALINISYVAILYPLKNQAKCFGMFCRGYAMGILGRNVLHSVLSGHQYV